MQMPVRPLPRLELAVRWALAVAIAYQVIQRFTYTGYGMSEYGRSLWYVTYDGQTWGADQRVQGVGVSTGCGACTFSF